jgi:saccharopine dehydrogenase-like NADP-dependent oxidoreductase
MKAFIFGMGRMGTAVSWAMHELGFELACADQDETAHDRWMKNAGLEVAMDVDFYHGDRLNNLDGGYGCLAEVAPDIVISCLPYHQTESLAKKCINNGIRYCDLGGRVDVSRNINNYAKEKAVKPVMTDLGLAPGWVNILAEEGCRQIHGQTENVTMMVGGLPDYLKSSDNPLRYKVTWSVDGLINEYRDDCIILKDGEIKTVKGMEGKETVETDSLGRLEAFYTSGGASHSIHSMKERGVKNCTYKTLRYMGHRDIVRFLIRDCDLDDETLNKIFVEGCGLADQDEVIVLASVSGDDRSWKKEFLIKSDDRFSAMQKATAFPVSSVAALMAEGFFDEKKDQRRDYHTYYPRNLSYKDVPYDEFKKNLCELKLIKDEKK